MHIHSPASLYCNSRWLYILVASQSFRKPNPLCFVSSFVSILHAFRTALRPHQGLLGLRCPRPICHIWSRAGLARSPVHPETASTCALWRHVGALNRVLMPGLDADSDANAGIGLCTPINSIPSGGPTSKNPRNGALRVSYHGLSATVPARHEAALTWILREPSHPVHPASP